MRKLSESQVEEIVKLHSEGKGLSELGRMFGVDHSSIYHYVGKNNRLAKAKAAYKYKYGTERPKILELTKPMKEHKVRMYLEPVIHNSLYKTYLEKFNAKQKKQDLPIKELFAHRIKK